MFIINHVPIKKYADCEQATQTTPAQKTCALCQRPFAWRKKWARCWDEVRYCSERCRRTAKQQSASGRQGHEHHR
ncbi:DUF2256 domain-containing protein [Halomonas sp. FME1]|uniref:DUF2256 domain-containing protein n=1 Tax=Halomonas casei TaxID=2742613 RepID=A0ABR9F5L6_9GAMM|nr:DUF2256 domain-containing protein [Halomonas casei]MBE0401730.1 DUF2256 domain-containing protein [Halomonas casei]